MIADLKPYPDYKESGLPWLGRVPVHWETRRLRHACEMRVSNVDKHTKRGETPVRLCNYVDVYKNERIRGSLRFMSASASEDERVRFRLRKGDVVITKDSEQWNDIGVPSLVEFEAPDLVCGHHLAILRSRPGLYGPFLQRALQCHFIAAQFHVEANGVTRYGLSQGAIRGVSIALPPSSEQATIVRFLDWTNGRLDRAIRAKRKVIALLTEQKQAIIHRAVTRGLDPTVPLKPSGIPCLGDIPQHWDVRRLKMVLRLQRGFDLPADRRKAGNVPVYSSGGHIDNHDVALASPPGVVIGRYGSTDAVFFVTEPYWPHNTALFTTTLYGNHARWCFYLLRSISKGAYAGKSAVPGVDRKDLFDIVVPRPPVREQGVIAMAIDNQQAEFDHSIAAITKEIELLREYRTRLVADVVTGKLDVREAAARLPDEPAADAPDEPADLNDETAPSDEEATA